MRGHSLFFSTGANVPTLAISYNKKCYAHMKMLGLENNVVQNSEITDNDLIIEKLDNIVKNRSNIENHLKRKVEEYYKLDFDFTNDWLSKL
jgi:polysaccharide pyruvyl transferase WcaK-like protein